MRGKQRQRPRAVAIRMLNLSTVALFALLAAAPTDAQEPVPGDVVRVDKGGPWLEYTFREIRGDTVFGSRPNGSIAAVPLTAVQRFQVRGPPKPREPETVLVPTLVGVSSGALVGLVIGHATTKREGVSCGFFTDPWTPCQRRPRLSYAREGAIGGALLGGAGGLFVGLVRMFVQDYRWRPVHIPSLAVQVAPSSTGVGVGLTWRL
jgi:hypothetical protein